jgi:DNA-binding FadR family transcriptional regulator
MNAPQYAATHVFQTLAIQILDGTIPAESKLPPERILAEQFGTSRIIVRQAVHRLADLGLLVVRQGGGTRVGDPAEADIRVLEVIYGAGVDHPLSRELSGHRFEATYLYAVGILDCAYRRGSREARAALYSTVKALPLGAEKDEVEAMIDHFWEVAVAMGGNRIIQMELAWWQRIGGARATAPVAVPITEKHHFYRTLAKQLALGQDPVPYYLAEIRPLLNMLR